MKYPDLHVFYDGGDYVIARDVEDAFLVWEEFAGPGSKHDGRTDPGMGFEELADNSLLSASLTEDSADARTQTMREWIEEIGRGWFCSENV